MATSKPRSGTPGALLSTASSQTARQPNILVNGGRLLGCSQISAQSVTITTNLIITLFTLHSSRFTLRISREGGCLCGWALVGLVGWWAPHRSPHDLKITLFTLHSSGFTLQISREGGCLCGWALVVWSAGGLLTDLRTISRSHSSLFTLRASLFRFREKGGRGSLRLGPLWSVVG